MSRNKDRLGGCEGGTGVRQVTLLLCPLQVNATMFMTLLAAWDVLLAKISGEDYIVCGLPYAGRSRAEVEGQQSHH